MSTIRTSRLFLHPVDTDEAERIVEGRPGPDDHWAADFPFAGDIIGATAFLRVTASDGDQGPFGFYVITRATDGLAIGGIGFKGRPAGRRVEVGYGLSPSARGHGYAREALIALRDHAVQLGVQRVVAETTSDNIASQRTLECAGFRQVGADDGFCHYQFLG